MIRVSFVVVIPNDGTVVAGTVLTVVTVVGVTPKIRGKVFVSVELAVEFVIANDEVTPNVGIVALVVTFFCCDIIGDTLKNGTDELAVVVTAFSLVVAGNTLALCTVPNVGKVTLMLLVVTAEEVVVTALSLVVVVV